MFKILRVLIIVIAAFDIVGLLGEIQCLTTQIDFIVENSVK